MARDDDDDDEDEEEEEDLGPLVAFQGALNGKPVDMAANARLTQVGLRPSKKFVTEGINRRAESIRLDIKGERASTTLVVDGMPYAGDRIPRQEGAAITQMMKLLAGLDPKAKGRPQTGGIKADFEGTPYEVQVEATPTPEGTERLTVRLRNLKDKKSSPDELGFNPKAKATIRELAARKQGLIIVCGPPGSGTTTTLYALLKGIDMYLLSVFAMCDMGNREVYNVTKQEFKEGATLKFTCERSMRAEGDVLFLGTLPEEETLRDIFPLLDEIAMMAEMPARDSADALLRLVKLIGDPQDVANRISGVFSQKLLRTLCPDCKEAFRPNPKLLEKVGLPADTKVMYRKGEPEADEETGEEPDPCGKCGGIGFLGRIALIEIITMTDGMKEVVASGGDAAKIKAQMRADGMLTFQKDGLRLVAEGKTSLEELQRIFKAPG